MANPRDLPIFPRFMRGPLVDALADTRVVFLMGARQVGKSTLAQSIAQQEHPAQIVTLDNHVVRAAAANDPTGFVNQFRGSVVIDEVQHVPELLLAIKEAVDKDKTPGRFLLTGSANVMRSRRVKDSLTGRLEVVRMWPLAQAEINSYSENFIDSLFANSPPEISNAPIGPIAFQEIVAQGGYPEARLREGRRRDAWFSSYLDTALDQDLKEISDALKLEAMPRLVRLLAAQAANLLGYKKIADKLDIHPSTVKAYVALLDSVFIVSLLPAWRPGIGAREVHSPKVHFVDPGLLAHLLEVDEQQIGLEPQATGKLFENLVATELLKQKDWAQRDARLFHYRDDREEIDFVLESRAGDLVAIEAKASASLSTSDWRPLQTLRDSRGPAFRCGVVVYTGEQTVQLSERLWAVPVSGLWSR